MIINQTGGGKKPTGTKNITSNGTHNVADYEYADVDVPTTAPDYYIEKTKDANGVLRGGNTVINFSGITDVANYALYYAYYNNTSITGALDMSSITTLSSDYGMTTCFYGCTGITSVDLSSLTMVSGNHALTSTFYNCTGITSADLSSLTTISGKDNSGGGGTQNCFYNCSNLANVNMANLTTITGSCSSMFFGCTSLINNNLGINNIKSLEYQSSIREMFCGCTSLTGTMDLGNLTTIDWGDAKNVFYGCTNITGVNLSKLSFVYAQSGSGGSGISYICYGCSSLTSLDLSSLTFAYANSSNDGVLEYLCYNCTSLVSMSFPKLAMLGGANSRNLYQAFYGCTSLQSVSFGGLPYNTMVTDNDFLDMLKNCDGVTVHFPSDWQTTMSSWTNVMNGFSGTNTTVLFDLAPVTVLDLSKVESFGRVGSTNRVFSTYSTVTKVDMSGLVIMSSGSMPYWFENLSNVIEIDLSNLRVMNGYLSNTFVGTGISTMSFYRLREVELSSTSSSSRFNNTFNGCTNLTDVYFPSFVDIKDYSRFSNMLAGTSGVTVHLPSNFLPGVTTATLTTTMGGTNTTVLKDLPAAVTLTGADTNEYIRNPKFDTATALSWYIIGSDTPYYTSTTADPVVSDTIYSDAACTVAVTTISSIA